LLRLRTADRRRRERAQDSAPRVLPIRRIYFASPTDKNAHDALATAAREVEAQLERAHTRSSPAEQSLARRRAEALLDDIDRRVLDLYDIGDADDRAMILALGAPLS